MAASREHSKLINSAAKAVLRPLGFKQKGRSRLWFADRGYWALATEFQPSGFGKGSYLNICATWLWGPGDGWTFDYFRRAGSLRRFESVTQFSEIAEQLATTAAAEMQRLDRQFGSVRDIAAYLKEEIKDNPPSLYNSAIAAGLIEDWNFSRSCFQKFVAGKEAHPFWEKVRTDSAPLIAAVGDTRSFQSAVRENVLHRRAALSLPQLSKLA